MWLPQEVPTNRDRSAKKMGELANEKDPASNSFVNKGPSIPCFSILFSGGWLTRIWWAWSWHVCLENDCQQSKRTIKIKIRFNQPKVNRNILTTWADAWNTDAWPWRLSSPFEWHRSFGKGHKLTLGTSDGLVIQPSTHPNTTITPNMTEKMIPPPRYIDYNQLPCSITLHLARNL